MSDLFRSKTVAEARWASFENPTGAKGAGGQTNQGCKGHPFERLEAGETKVLMDVQGSGIIQRMWMTVSDRSPLMLRSLRLDMFWDGAEHSAVSAPLGDFFCAGLGRLVPFENALFSSPEGNSFNMIIPMPFRTRAVVTLTNESDSSLHHLFYDINYSLMAAEADWLYFHAYWNREKRTTLGQDYTILPSIQGTGRLLGVNIGVATDPKYAGSWWGEGEVKLFLDGDTEYPTLVGTGTEDYIGTAWGQDTFTHRYQGCLTWDKTDGSGSFYRFHIPDPIYFRADLRMTIQQIGGAPKEVIAQIAARGGRYKVITADAEGVFTRFLAEDCTKSWEDDSFGAAAWMNFLREDDFSSTAYFYLNRPDNGLPGILEVAARRDSLQHAITSEQNTRTGE
ncbi:glycoside hydrolase family 172 protein [Paenibacillus borealis]|uniref:glycoside hydrolase family 172 protein n=1 Tax=Paenibacillus borealis TaxID=160799 RepID=UPI0005A700FD|nr:glycoside hydrolase family 172 protein [Paenibacillus borealis]